MNQTEDTYDHYEKRPSLVEQHEMKDIIERFDDQQYSELFKIIQKYDAAYSKNSNGIFINFKQVSDEALIEIHKYVEYIKQTNYALDNRAKNK